MFVSVSSLFPLINLMALAVSFIEKSNDTFDLVAFVYLSIQVLASTNSIGLQTLLSPPLTPAINPSTSPLL